MKRKDETAAGAGEAPKLDWRIAQVCPVSRRPWDEEGFCWTCNGIHVPRTDHACRTCRGRLALDGYCWSCQDKGGGIGYHLLRVVHFRDEHEPAGIGRAPVYDRQDTVWWPRDEVRRKLRELVRELSERMTPGRVPEPEVP